MLINGKAVNLDEPATFYEDRFNHGTYFSHLAQAISHAVATSSSQQMHAASIVTQSGEQFGWTEISLLHDHLRNDAARPDRSAHESLSTGTTACPRESGSGRGGDG
ncbi:hypothetical protein ACFFTN_21455 [Aminobacter aganoensis]|uniref:Uncharacterized protein n=1 Tax=Aminobacter aganoensis TaxID=83264 RepID=A0A7X0FCG5_9HYPH|nr:hypothetical protein [Aminobacter aganoensis]MBB6357146.1 hypothetical protein [Aminobacter aganoensis]